MRFVRNMNAFGFGLLVAVLLATCTEAIAGGSSGPDVDVDVGTETIVNTDAILSNEIAGDALNIAGDRAIAVGGSSFDVDINQCLGSKSTNIVIVGWQSLHENPTCIADGLDARGNHRAAANVRCKHVETIYSSFDNFDQCVNAVTMDTLAFAPPPESAAVSDKDEDDGHQEEMAELQAQMNSLIQDKQRSDAASARYAAAQRKRRAEEVEYAQQMIEQIQQIEEPPSDQ